MDYVICIFLGRVEIIGIMARQDRIHPGMYFILEEES